MTALISGQEGWQPLFAPSARPVLVHTAILPPAAILDWVLLLTFLSSTLDTSSGSRELGENFLSENPGLLVGSLTWLSRSISRKSPRAAWSGFLAGCRLASGEPRGSEGGVSWRWRLHVFVFSEDPLSLLSPLCFALICWYPCITEHWFSEKGPLKLFLPLSSVREHRPRRPPCGFLRMLPPSVWHLGRCQCPVNAGCHVCDLS